MLQMMFIVLRPLREECLGHEVALVAVGVPLEADAPRFATKFVWVLEQLQLGGRGQVARQLARLAEFDRLGFGPGFRGCKFGRSFGRVDSITAPLAAVKAVGWSAAIVAEQ